MAKDNPPPSGAFALIDEIARAGCMRRAFDLAVGHFARFGFSRANYGMAQLRSDGWIGDVQDVLFLTTEGPDHFRQYFLDGFFMRTAQFRWAMENTGATTWTWVQRAHDAGILPAHEAEAVRLNLARGIRAGVTISFPEAAARVKGALGFIADAHLDHEADDGIWAQHGGELSAIAHVLHLRILQLPPQGGFQRLTPRQAEVLEWIAEGKTLADVAVILGISPAMVEKHLRLARSALEVDTTAQAVAKATILNLIPRAPEPDV